MKFWTASRFLNYFISFLDYGLVDRELQMEFTGNVSSNCWHFTKEILYLYFKLYSILLLYLKPLELATFVDYSKKWWSVICTFCFGKLRKQNINSWFFFLLSPCLLLKYHMVFLKLAIFLFSLLIYERRTLQLLVDLNIPIAPRQHKHHFTNVKSVRILQ